MQGHLQMSLLKPVLTHFPSHTKKGLKSLNLKSVALGQDVFDLCVCLERWLSGMPAFVF